MNKFAMEISTSGRSFMNGHWCFMGLYKPSGFGYNNQ